MEYSVFLGNDIVGSVKLTYSGLYVNVFCSCRMQTGIWRLYAKTSKDKVLIGVCEPIDNELRISKRIPLKKLEKIQGFILANRQPEEHKLIAICGNEEFSAIAYLAEGKFLVISGQAYMRYADQASVGDGSNVSVVT